LETFFNENLKVESAANVNAEPTKGK
jgi:hypothetical protein